MQTIEPHKILIEKPSELPDLSSGVKRLFLDVETRWSVEWKPKYSAGEGARGTYPWKGDRICGVSVTWDDNPDSFYIPVRHSRGGNLPVDVFQRWLKDTLASGASWINHFVVFDAVMAHFEGAEFAGPLVCTCNLAKLLDSDRWGHGLKTLVQDWLGRKELGEHEMALKDYLKRIGSSSYGDVPIDLMTRYACGDALEVRDLFHYIIGLLHSSQQGVLQTEVALTPVLYDMELDGMRVEPLQLKKELLFSTHKMIQAGDTIAQITEREYSNSSMCKYDILCTQHGLPILKTVKERDEDGKIIDTGRPSFDKEAMAQYAVHPMVTAKPELLSVVNAMMLYATESTFKGLFCEAFLDLHDDNNRIHPHYNQSVRTGRMSASRPNSQQQNKRSKRLILPDEGCGIMSMDYSQIEYRLIVHYIQDLEAIAAYNDDPNTDFHTWVAGIMGVDRPAGKLLNFGMAYGQGKRGVTGQLAANPEIISRIGEEVNELVRLGHCPEAHRHMVFVARCAEHASLTYDQYHARFPKLKITAMEAERSCKKYGYIFNAYGRRRYIPKKFARKAFNSVVQGCAADISKERLVAISPRYNEKVRALGIRPCGIVHDELVFHVPLEHLYNPEVHAYFREMLETTSVKFDVPIKVGLGVSPNNWMEAADDKNVVRDESGNFVAGPISEAA